MRTRLVRVRRRPRGLIWATVFLALAMALYIRVTLPALRNRPVEVAVAHGERTTRRVTLDALSVWLVSFGRYGERSAAQAEAARYTSRGAAGYVAAGDDFRVIGAGYESQADAEKVCARLEAEEGIVCAAEQESAPETTLRITAGSGQIAAFLEAERTLRTAAGAIGQLAFSVDRGEVTADQAAEVLAMHRDSATLAAEQLAAQTGSAEAAAFSALNAMLEEMAAQIGDIMEETEAMALSGRLKHCHVEYRLREIEWLNRLNAQTE